MDKDSRKEILFYYESRQNPNGDPGFENQPRLMPDGTIIVTDVRIKRTIRDYIKNSVNDNNNKKFLFVDYNEDGNPIKADERAKGLLKKIYEDKEYKKDFLNLDNKNNQAEKNKFLDLLKSDDKDSNKELWKLLKKLQKIHSFDLMRELLKSTADVQLFGAFVPITSKDESIAGRVEKLTGPVQFGIGRSVNKVNIINPLISTHFVGQEKITREEQFASFGRFYSVEYALIKIHGAINPLNLDKYYDDEEIRNNFNTVIDKDFPGYLWNGTNQLITRSKFPQRSIFYLEVEYNSVVYNDLPVLVDEDQKMKGNVTNLCQDPFEFKNLIETLEKRKDKIKKVRINYCNDIKVHIKKKLIDGLRIEDQKIIDLGKPKQKKNDN